MDTRKKQREEQSNTQENNFGLVKQVLSSMYKQNIQRLKMVRQKDGMVSFHEDPEQYKSSEMVGHTDSSIQRLMALSKKLTSIDENISCDHAYLMKTGRERARFDFEDFDNVPHKYF